MGKAHYFIFSGDVLGSFQFDFADFIMLALFVMFFQDWGEHVAVRTPVRPEIDNNPSIRPQYLSFKCFSCHLCNSHDIQLLRIIL